MASSPTKPTIAARLDRLPACSCLRWMVVLLSFGGCVEFYDIFLTAYIAPALYRSGIFTATTKGIFGLEGIASFVAAFFAGLFLGTLCLGRLADRFGRRAVFSFALCWYSACTLVMAFQQTAAAIDFWRLAAGIGVGVELVTIDTYLSELVPKGRRGPAFAFNQFITFLAVPLVAFLAYLLGTTRWWNLDGWRWVVLIGSSGALLIFFIRRVVPESPRWLEQRGRLDEADEVMRCLENRVEREIKRPLPAPQSFPGEVVQGTGAFKELWQAPYGRRTVMLMVFNFCQAIGFYGFANWAPTFLLANGINVTKSLEYTFLIALANPVGPLIGWIFAERWQRKWQIVWSAVSIAVFGLCFAQQRVPVAVIVTGILVTLSNNWMSFTFHAYQAELYPTRIRAQAVGFVYSWSRLGGMIGSFIIAFVLKGYGTAGVFVFIALCMFLVAIVIGGFGPLTNNRRLEEIAR
jgi:putative MFS transporter